MITMEQIASDVVIDEAYEWLCRRRAEYSDSNDVWNLLAGSYILTRLLLGEFHGV